eukprot:8150356-Alexandrium_andersonii.AAC.1
MRRFGDLSEEDLRILTEMENWPEARFLMAWETDRLFIRAAQGHNGGVSDNIDMAQALEWWSPATSGGSTWGSTARR